MHLNYSSAEYSAAKTKTNLKCHIKHFCGCSLLPDNRKQDLKYNVWEGICSQVSQEARNWCAAFGAPGVNKEGSWGEVWKGPPWYHGKLGIHLLIIPADHLQKCNQLHTQLFASSIHTVLFTPPLIGYRDQSNGRDLWNYYMFPPTCWKRSHRLLDHLR